MSTEENTESTPEDLRAQFGKATTGNGVNIITVDDGGSKTVRLLPPMKSLKQSGAWGVYHKQHYGYAVQDPKDATKTRMRPFLCVEEKDENKATVKSCPECRHVEAVKQKMKDDIAEIMKEQMSQGLTREAAEVAAKEATNETEEWLKAHNLDQKWFIPVMLEDGNFGILKVPHAAKKAIEKARKALREQEERDVFDIDQGAWLKISRSGSGRETEYDATIVKHTVTLEGQKVTVTKPAPLSDDNLRTALNLPDVNTSSALVRRLTVDQIRMLAESGGTPDEVAAVLNLGQKEQPKEEQQKPAPAQPTRTGASGGTGYQPKPAAPAAAKPAQAAPKPAAQAAKPAVAPKPAQAAKPAPAPAAEEDEEAKLLRQLEEARARKAAKQTQVAAPPAAAPTPEALDPDISDDEFAARFPPPN